jgi:hypothetical protein
MDYLQHFGMQVSNGVDYRSLKLASQGEIKPIVDVTQMMKSFSVLARELNLHELADACLAASQGLLEAPPFRIE